MPNTRSTAQPSTRSPRRVSSPIAWWFGSVLLVAAAFVLLFYVQVVHAAVERGAMARAAALPSPSANGLAAASVVDPFGPEARHSAVRTVKAVRAVPAAVRQDHRVADSTL